MQAQMNPVSATQKNAPLFMDVEGVDKIEVLWLNRNFGSPTLQHPVAQRRARAILDQIRMRVQIHPQITELQGYLKEQTAGISMFKRQAG